MKSLAVFSERYEEQRIVGCRVQGSSKHGVEPVDDCARPDYSLMATIWAWRHRPFAQRKKQRCY